MGVYVLNTELTIFLALKGSKGTSDRLVKGQAGFNPDLMPLNKRTDIYMTIYSPLVEGLRIALLGHVRRILST